MAAADLDQTSLATLDLLESRLLRIEHLLYGQAASPTLAQDQPAVEKIRDLEHRLSTLVSRIRVYAEILKIYQAHPDFFHAPDASEPPSQLSIDAIQAIVLASASAFPSIQSSLTTIKDSPIPDPAESAALIALGHRMKAIEATQLAQAAEMSELRKRSEAVIRSWYENGVIGHSTQLADLETRVEKAERHVRRVEWQIEGDDAV